MLMTWYIDRYRQKSIVISKINANIKLDTDLRQKAHSSCSKTSTRDKYSSGQMMQHTNWKLKIEKKDNHQGITYTWSGNPDGWCHYLENS